MICSSTNPQTLHAAGYIAADIIIHDGVTHVVDMDGEHPQTTRSMEKYTQPSSLASSHMWRVLKIAIVKWIEVNVDQVDVKVYG